MDTITFILSLSNRRLGILAALVKHTDDNNSGGTYDTSGDWFGHLSSVARTIRETVPGARVSLEEDPTHIIGLWKMLTPPHRPFPFVEYIDEPGWDSDEDFRYYVTPEVYALKDVIIAAANTRLAQS